jgi:hypothetical protein
MTSSRDIFEDRKDYKDFDGFVIGIDNFEEFREPDPIDLWYDKQLYGRIDQQGNAVLIGDDTFAQQENIKMIGDTGVYALDFVVNSFNDLKRRIDNIIAYRGRFSGPTIGGSSIIRDFTPKKGMSLVRPLYQDYTRQYFNAFTKEYLRSTFRDKLVRNFGDFVDLFVEFSLEYGNRYPITPTGFIKSQFCSPLVSGLMIEISFDDHDDDEMKGVFIDDVSFNFYHSLAKKYGFYVDKNAPWRLVANIASPQMQRYWIRSVSDPTMEPFQTPEEEDAIIRKQCRDIIETTTATGLIELQYTINGKVTDKQFYPNSVKNLFDTHYIKSFRFDLPALVELLLEHYNEYVSSFPKVILEKDENCANEIWKLAGKPTTTNTKIFRRTIERKIVSFDEFSKYGSVLKLIKMLVSLRAKEEGIILSKPRYDQIIRKANRIYQTFDKKDLDNGLTMEYINGELKGFPVEQTKATSFSLSDGSLTSQDGNTGY